MAAYDGILWSGNGVKWSSAFTVGPFVPSADLIVGSITPATTSVQQGTSLSFSYIITDQGSAAAGLNYSAWQVDGKPVPGNTLGWDKINALAANSSTSSFTDSISTGNLSFGTHTLWVGADTWNYISEGDESNNWTSVNFTVTAPPLPDLIVSSVTPATTSVQQGTSLSFSYVVKNQGTVAAGLNYSAWQIDSKPTTGIYLGWDTVNSLAANTTVSFNDSISTSNLSVGTHTLWVATDKLEQCQRGRREQQLDFGQFHGHGAAVARPDRKQHHPGDD